MDRHGIWRQVAGLFLELPPEQTPEVPAQEHPQTPNMKAERTEPADAPAPQAVGAFGAVYAQAGVPAASFGAEPMREMLASLPAELPLAIRRQTVQAALNALGKSLGATAETILADAAGKRDALAAYIESVEQAEDAHRQAAETEIAALQTQIAEKRRAVEEAARHRDRVIALCREETARLDEVAEFFQGSVPNTPDKAPDGTR